MSNSFLFIDHETGDAHGVTNICRGAWLSSTIKKYLKHNIQSYKQKPGITACYRGETNSAAENANNVRKQTGDVLVDGSVTD